MRSLGLIMLGAALLLGGCAGQEGYHHDLEDGVFIHLSRYTEDPHRVGMAFQMASLMADGGTKVLVYCDIKAVNLLLKDGKDVVHKHFPGSKAQIEKLLAQGVGVYACPGCLKAAGKSPEDLMPGVQVANKDAFFDFCGGRILTLDY